RGTSDRGVSAHPHGRVRRQAIECFPRQGAVMRALWKPLTIIGGLLVLLTYFLVQSRSVDLTLRSRMHDALQRVQLHDTQLTRDVLLARAGLLPNYDPMTQTGAKLARAVAELHSRSLTIAGEPGRRIAREARTLADAVREKARLLEYFKSDNALLHNSLAYI